MNKVLLFLLIVFFLSISTSFANDLKKDADIAARNYSNNLNESELLVLREILNTERSCHLELYYYTSALFLS